MNFSSKNRYSNFLRANHYDLYSKFFISKKTNAPVSSAIILEIIVSDDLSSPLSNILPLYRPPFSYLLLYISVSPFDLPVDIFTDLQPLSIRIRIWEVNEKIL